MTRTLAARCSVVIQCYPKTIGNAGFIIAGQLPWHKQGGETIVEGNTTNDVASAGLRITFDSLLNFRRGDFLFNGNG